MQEPQPSGINQWEKTQKNGKTKNCHNFVLSNNPQSLITSRIFCGKHGFNFCLACGTHLKFKT